VLSQGLLGRCQTTKRWAGYGDGRRQSKRIIMLKILP